MILNHHGRPAGLSEAKLLSADGKPAGTVDVPGLLREGIVVGFKWIGTTESGGYGVSAIAVLEGRRIHVEATDDGSLEEAVANAAFGLVASAIQAFGPQPPDGPAAQAANEDAA